MSINGNDHLLLSQSRDTPLEVYLGLFRDNGGCGYVLKPEFLRNRFHFSLYLQFLNQIKLLGHFKNIHIYIIINLHEVRNSTKVYYTTKIIANMRFNPFDPASFPRELSRTIKIKVWNTYFKRVWKTKNNNDFCYTPKTRHSVEMTIAHLQRQIGQELKVKIVE